MEVRLDVQLDVELTTGDPSLSLPRSMVAPTSGSMPRWILRVVLLAAALAAAVGALLLPARQRSLTGAEGGTGPCRRSPMSVMHMGEHTVTPLPSQRERGRG